MKNSQTEGVLLNINPRIAFTVKEPLRVDFVQRALNEVEDIEFLRFEQEEGSYIITLDNNRVNLASISEFTLEYSNISDKQIQTKLSLLLPAIDIEGRYTGINPAVRGNNIVGDLLLEVKSDRVNKRELIDIRGPSMSVNESGDRFVITGEFPDNLFIKRLDSGGLASAIVEKTDALEQDITFTSRAVSTDIRDTLGL